MPHPRCTSYPRGSVDVLLVGRDEVLKARRPTPEVTWRIRSFGAGFASSTVNGQG